MWLPLSYHPGLFSANLGSTAQVSGTTANDFTTSVTYTITAADGVTTQDWVIMVTDEITETETVEDNSQRVNYYSPGSKISNYRIIAIPFASRNVLNTFEELGEFDRKKWRLVSYNASANAYNDVTGNLSPGVGYFFLSLDPVTLKVGGDGVSLTDEAFRKSLSAGFNLIGNPFTGTLDWNEVVAYNITLGNMLEGDIDALITFNGDF